MHSINSHAGHHSPIAFGYQHRNAATKPTHSNVHTPPPTKLHIANAQTNNTARIDFLSNKDKGEPPRDIWTGFYASYHWDHHDDWAGPIKAAMSGLGQSPLGIFDEVARTENGYNITMKDNFKLHITDKELALATHYAKFSGTDEGMLKDARFLFAVMNKRRHIDYHYDVQHIDYSNDLRKRSFNATLQASDYGIQGHQALKLLGLGTQLKQVWSQDVKNEVGVPATNPFPYRRGMISEGFMDSYGQKKSAPKWIESFIVLKEPHTSMPPPLVTPSSPPKPRTFTLEPLPNSNPEALGELPDLSKKRNGQKPDDPMLGFYTTRPYMFEGETSTHADVIKLLMNKFGQSPTDVFSSVKYADNVYAITFRDGVEVKLSRDELELAEDNSRFTGNDDGLLQDANFIFAAYIKRQQLQPPEPGFGLSFEAALERNLTGRTVKSVLEGMGVTHSIKYVERAGDADGMVLLSAGNAGGLFKDGALAKEGQYHSEDGATQKQGYQLV